MVPIKVLQTAGKFLHLEMLSSPLKCPESTHKITLSQEQVTFHQISFKSVPEKERLVSSLAAGQKMMKPLLTRLHDYKELLTRYPATLQLASIIVPSNLLQKCRLAAYESNLFDFTEVHL